MNEYWTAIVVFFGAFVGFCTVVIGLLKVWKPLKNGGHKGNIEQLTLVQLLNETEERMRRQDDRIKDLKGEVKTLRSMVTDCEERHKKLETENEKLKQRLSDSGIS